MALVLRTCKPDGTSYKGFQWNLESGGTTTALDWKPSPECGNGLHGFLNGEGDGTLADWSDKAIWLVVEPIGQIINLDGKVKFESAITRFVGDRQQATDYLVEKIGKGYAVIGATFTDSDKCTVISGDFGKAISGHFGKAISGRNGSSIVGNYGTAIAGYGGTVMAGNGGTIAIFFEDGLRMRLKVGYIDEDGLKPNTPYCVNENDSFVSVCWMG